MFRYFYIIILLTLSFTNICCDIFGDKSEKEYDSDWKRVSMPTQLRGEWYINNFKYMTISSSKVTIDNREWSISTVSRKGEEYRFVTRGDVQYRAMYFKNITDSSAEFSLGYIAFTEYDAKEAGIEKESFITKK